MAAIYSYSIFIQSKTIALNFRQLDQTLRKVSLEAEGKKKISSCWVLRAGLVSSAGISISVPSSEGEIRGCAGELQEQMPLKCSFYAQFRGCQHSLYFICEERSNMINAC